VERNAMTNDSKHPGNASPQGVVERSGKARSALLGLHRALIASERIEYERLHGRVESSGEMLKLVTGDPWFAWLRPLSETIVRLDEMLDADEDNPEDLLQLITQVRALIVNAASEGEFGRRYQAALQRDPNVVIEHGRAVKSLG
jgi:hypothetical protein